ncbi:tRNA-intron endonuclease [Batrachochytrium salamandrivorans]|nr:tRNA-intron endonuclease [Batrachochytrium salamandrivorans]
MMRFASHVSSCSAASPNTNAAGMATMLAGLVWDPKAALTLRRDWRILGGLVGGFVPSPLQNAYHGLPLVLMPEQVALLVSMNAAVVINDCNSHSHPTAAEVASQEALWSQHKDDYNGLWAAYAAHMKATSLRTKGLDGLDDTASAIVPMNPPTLPIAIYTQSDSLHEQPFRNLIFADFWKQGWFISSGSKFGGDFLLYESDPSLCHAKYIVKVTDADAPLTGADIIRAGRLATFSKKIFMYCYWDALAQRVESMPISWVK